MIHLLSIALLCFVVRALWKYFFPGRRAPVLSKDEEDHIKNVLTNVDDGDLEVDEEVGSEEKFFSPTACRGRFISKVILAAKAEFGLLQRSRANYLMVRKFMRDLMRERKMRPSHIAQHLDPACAMFSFRQRVISLHTRLGHLRVLCSARENCTRCGSPFPAILVG